MPFIFFGLGIGIGTIFNFLIFSFLYFFKILIFSLKFLKFFSFLLLSFATNILFLPTNLAISST